MRKVMKVAAAVAATGAVAACGSSGNTAKPIADVAQLSGVSTSVKLDSGFMKALTALHITPGTVGSATISGTTVTFPITGGHVTVYKKALKGEIDHQGSGLSLSAGSTNVTVTNLVADAGSKWLLSGDVSVNGKLLAMKADLFTVDDSSLKPISVSGATARATGATVDLSVNGAQALDEAFHTQQLEELAAIGAAKLGTATLTLKVK